MNKIIQLWEYINSQPKHYELAAKELETAKKEYLQHKTLQEYYSNLCTFETQRMKRLEQYLGVTNQE